MGFVPGREAKDNVIKVLNLIQLAFNADMPCLFLFTNTEKAFDTVNWAYLHSTLRHIGVNPNFKGWFGAIYAYPSVTVNVNDMYS